MIQSPPHKRQTQTEYNLPIDEAAQGATVALLLITVILFVIVCISFLFRVLARRRIVKTLQCIDYFVIATLVFFTAFSGVTVALCFIGKLGFSTITADTMIATINTLIPAEVFYVMTMTTLKISCALLLYKKVPKKWQRFLIKCLVAVSTVFAVVYISCTIFQCGIPGKNGSVGKKRATNSCETLAVYEAVGFSYCIMNVATNVGFVFLSVVAIHDSKVALYWKKFAYTIAVLLFLGSIASVIRICWRDVLEVEPRKVWHGIMYLLLPSQIEASFGAIAICMFALRPLLRKPTKHVEIVLVDDEKQYTHSRNSSNNSSHKSTKSYKSNTTSSTKTPRKPLLKQKGSQSKRPSISSNDPESQPTLNTPRRPSLPACNPAFQPLRLNSISQDSKESKFTEDLVAAYSAAKARSPSTDSDSAMLPKPLRLSPSSSLKIKVAPIIQTVVTTVTTGRDDDGKHNSGNSEQHVYTVPKLEDVSHGNPARYSLPLSPRSAAFNKTLWSQENGKGDDVDEESNQRLESSLAEGLLSTYPIPEEDERVSTDTEVGKSPEKDNGKPVFRCPGGFV